MRGVVVMLLLFFFSVLFSILVTCAHSKTNQLRDISFTRSVLELEYITGVCKQLFICYCYSRTLGQHTCFMLSMLGKIFSRRHLEIVPLVFCFFFCLENRLKRDNLHEMSKLIFWRKNKRKKQTNKTHTHTHTHTNKQQQPKRTKKKQTMQPICYLLNLFREW